MLIRRHIRSLWPWRWWNCLRSLICGVRIHPTACYQSDVKSILMGYGTKIGARCRLDAGTTGRIVSGDRVWVSSDVEFETTTEIYIGEGTTIQRRCTINGGTRIGAGCIFAPNVFVSSGTHPFRAIPHLPIREQERALAASAGGSVSADQPIWIQDDCWLGTNVVVCPGVTIGKGSVVGANAVVTRDIAPYSVVAGAPARIIGRRLEWRPKASIRAECEEDFPYVVSGLYRPASDLLPPRFEASGDVPFFAALSAEPNYSGVLYSLIATVAIAVEVEGQVFEIKAGMSTLEVAKPFLLSPEGHLDCTIKLKKSATHAVLWIVAVRLVGTLTENLS